MRNDQEQARRCQPWAAVPAVEQVWQGCILQLTPAQLFHFEWHLLRLGDSCRRSRFGRPASDAFLRAYRAAIDDPDWIALGCFLDGQLRGAVELDRSGQAGASGPRSPSPSKSAGRVKVSARP
jgi:branched-subunit amino acid aminotransferase/4-amino-4-deoxychorismate lyase